MAGYVTGLAYGFSNEVLAPLAGGLAGAGQVAVTNVLDAQGSLGKAIVPQVWPTNGELINTVTGGAALGAVTLAASGHGSYLRSRPKALVAVLSYGVITLAAGWLIPGLVRVLSNSGVFRAGARRGGGRFAYLPSAQLRADAAARQGFADYGSGITSQANQQVLRRLFTSQ
jgi:hypothetical protein